MYALNYESKTNHADFTDWMSFLPSKLMKKISPNLKAFSANTQNLSLAWNITEETKMI